MALKYQRILLKISGEALGVEKGTGFDEPTMDAICGGVKKAHDLGVQIGIVVGGGNFWRGRSSGKMERTLVDVPVRISTGRRQTRSECWRP